jgi:hypothetical protein
MEINFEFDLSDYMRKLEEFLESMNGTEADVSQLGVEELTAWDDPAGEGRQRIKGEVVAQMVGAGSRATIVVVDADGLLISLGRKGGRDEWEFLDFDEEFREPAGNLIPGFPG